MNEYEFYEVTIGLEDVANCSIECICKLNKKEADLLLNKKASCGGCSSNNKCIICAGAYIKYVNRTMFDIYVNEDLVDTILFKIKKNGADAVAD